MLNYIITLSFGPDTTDQSEDLSQPNNWGLYQASAIRADFGDRSLCVFSGFAVPNISSAGPPVEIIAQIALRYDFQISHFEGITVNLGLCNIGSTLAFECGLDLLGGISVTNTKSNEAILVINTIPLYVANQASLRRFSYQVITVVQPRESRLGQSVRKDIVIGQALKKFVAPQRKGFHKDCCISNEGK